jgi:type IV pilus assembly protein PilB
MHDMESWKRFGQVLVEREVITQYQRELAMEIQDLVRPWEPIGEVMTKNALITQRHCVETLGIQYDLPVRLLMEPEIPQAVIAQVDAYVARLYRIVPVAVIDELLCIALADPTDATLLEELRDVLHRHIALCLSTPSDIAVALEYYYSEAA